MHKALDSIPAEDFIAYMKLKLMLLKGGRGRTFREPGAAEEETRTQESGVFEERSETDD